MGRLKSGVLHSLEAKPGKALTDFDRIVSVQVGTAEEVGPH